MTSKDIVAGLVTPIVIIVSTLSYVASIFTGPFAGVLPMAIGYGLVSAAIMAFLFALFSDVPFVIAGPDSKPAAVLAAMAAAMTAPLVGRAATATATGGGRRRACTPAPTDSSSPSRSPTTTRGEG